MEISAVLPEAGQGSQNQRSRYKRKSQSSFLKQVKVLKIRSQGMNRKSQSSFLKQVKVSQNQRSRYERKSQSSFLKQVKVLKIRGQGMNGNLSRPS